MSKLLDFYNKFEVSPFAAIFVIATLLTNSYKLFFIFFMITFIHELGHVLMAKILKLKINKIKLLAVGFNAEIEDIDYTSSVKEFLIAIAGPLTYFLSLYLLKYMYKTDFISYNAYTQSLIVNKYTLVFNLLPIIPLDGGRILKLIIDNFLTSKKAMIITTFLSNIFVIVFIYYTRLTPQWLMYIFLILTNITYIFNVNKRWKSFLINRLTIINKYKKKIHRKHDLYRNRDNYIILNKQLLNEKQAILSFIKNNRGVN